MIPEDIVMNFKLALLVPSMRTPFALLLIAGAAVAAFGILRLSSATGDLERDPRINADRSRSLLSPAKKELPADELREDLGLMDNGFTLMSIGIVMIVIGMIPFVTGRD